MGYLGFVKCCSSRIKILPPILFYVYFGLRHDPKSVLYLIIHMIIPGTLLAHGALLTRYREKNKFLPRVRLCEKLVSKKQKIQALRNICHNALLPVIQADMGGKIKYNKAVAQLIGDYPLKFSDLARQ